MLSFVITSSNSSFNSAEVKEVISIIQILLASGSRLKQSDIGVVSPYKLQCRKIAKACQTNHFNDIAIGTTEVFQGKEKKAMIISTVVSHNGQPGYFISNPKVGNNFIKQDFMLFQRMNVMITRAQFLLFIIGNHSTLSRDNNWLELIDYCRKNDALEISHHRPYARNNYRK